MNSGVADRAVGISDRRLVMERGDARHIGLGNGTVTFDAELPDRTAVKHFRIAGPVRRVASRTALGL